MKLKVLHIGQQNIVRNTVNHKTILEARIDNEQSFDAGDFHLLSLFINSSPSSYGVRNRSNGVKTPLADTLEAEDSELIKIRFIIIDIKNGALYFDGALHDVKVILKELFDTESSTLSYEVGVEDFIRLSKLSIVTKQLLNSETPGMLTGLFQDGSIQGQSTYEIEFSDGRKFSKSKLSKILEQEESGRKIMVSGYDEKGDEINISSTLSRKFEILPEQSDWESKSKLTLERVLEAFKKEKRYENPK